VATVLIGTAKPSSLQRNLAVLETQVPQEAWQAFDDVAMNK
jgi:D-threo-aldose 1-dehydrogenase